MGIFSVSNALDASAETSFWNWFEKNEEMLFHFDTNTEVVFDELSTEIEKVNPKLRFEFSAVKENGKREFVITAAGIKSAFPFVESLFNAAPKLERWEVIKYRQRKSLLNDFDLEYCGKSIAATDVHYKLYHDGEKPGIVVFLDGYNENEQDVYGNFGFLFLDDALGEYDVEMKLGFIEFCNRESKDYEGARPLSELAAHFDHYFGSKGK
jgi:hypothetical protein